MGLDWLLTEFRGEAVNSWIYPRFKLFYNPLLRYADLFVAHPGLPFSFAGPRRLLSYYMVNPFQLRYGPNLRIFSLSPILLVCVTVLPVFVLFYKKSDRFLRWLAFTLLLGYGVKLINYPLLEPPKSEVFQWLPAAILVACSVESWGSLVGKTRRRVLTILVLVLLPIIYINAYRTYRYYSGYIKTYSFANTEKMAATFNQSWYVQNLNEEDTLFGRHPNQVCYIKKPKLVLFFWEAMHFVPWETIEDRIDRLDPTAIYDDSKPPKEFESRYDEILPILENRDPALHGMLTEVFSTYERNYVLKEKFLSAHYDPVMNDGAGTIYRRK